MGYKLSIFLACSAAGAEASGGAGSAAEQHDAAVAAVAATATDNVRGAPASASTTRISGILIVVASVLYPERTRMPPHIRVRVPRHAMQIRAAEKATAGISKKLTTHALPIRQYLVSIGGFALHCILPVCFPYTHLHNTPPPAPTGVYGSTSADAGATVAVQGASRRSLGLPSTLFAAAQSQGSGRGATTTNSRAAAWRPKRRRRGRLSVTIAAALSFMPIVENLMQRTMSKGGSLRAVT